METHDLEGGLDKGLQFFESIQSAAYYEARTDYKDNERFKASLDRFADFPDVAEWLSSLSPEDRSTLGL